MPRQMTLHHYITGQAAGRGRFLVYAIAGRHAAAMLPPPTLISILLIYIARHAASAARPPHHRRQAARSAEVREGHESNRPITPRHEPPHARPAVRGFAS